MRYVFTVIAWLALIATASAEIKPMSLFQTGAVLQREKPVPVWGTATPGEKITVSIDGRTADATADGEGRWLAKLPALKAGGPFELKIAGDKSAAVTISDVLVGEVWIASGQSNMEMKLSTVEGGEGAVKAASDKQIRFATMNMAHPYEPARDVNAKWEAASPETAGNWSAAAYFFALDLRKKLGVPVGIVQNARGWTPAEAWTSREAMLADPDLKIIVDRWDLWTNNGDAARKAFEKKLLQIRAVNADLMAKGREPRPEPPAPWSSDFMHRASGLFNGNVAPLAPFAIRGVLWYQGETNSSRAAQYRKLFPALIGSWRKAWGEELPFIFVQIAPLDAGPVDRAELREAQREALKMPNTAMVVTLDIGDAKDEHPKKKREVGERLALAARKLAYGEDVVFSGPLLKDFKIEGDHVRLTFAHVGGGLTAKDGKLEGFVIAGDDQKFVPAEAKIDGETIVVAAGDVKEPKAVRYAWQNNASANLFNKEGLPASGFRTDAWPLTTAGEWRMYFEQIGLDETTLTPKAAP